MVVSMLFCTMEFSIFFGRCLSMSSSALSSWKLKAVLRSSTIPPFFEPGPPEKGRFNIMLYYLFCNYTLPHSLSLSHTHTHTNGRTHTRTYTLTYMHVHTRTHTRVHPCTLFLTHMHARAHTILLNPSLTAPVSYRSDPIREAF